MDGGRVCCRSCCSVSPSPDIRGYWRGAVATACVEKKKSSPATKHVLQGAHVNEAIGGVDPRTLLGTPTASAPARTTAIRSVAEKNLPLLIC